jgi:hypothetical protein
MESLITGILERPFYYNYTLLNHYFIVISHSYILLNFSGHVFISCWINELYFNITQLYVSDYVFFL